MNKTNPMPRGMFMQLLSIFAAILLSACPIGTNVAVEKTGASGVSITSISPENPVDGETVLLVGKGFTAADNIKAAVVFADGSSSTATLTVANSKNASFVMPATKSLRLSKIQILRDKSVLTSFDIEETGIGMVVAPVISAVQSANGSSLTITMTTATQNAAIYYTVNGSTPTTSSSLYSGAITV
jgi:hypothetical protein